MSEVGAVARRLGLGGRRETTAPVRERLYAVLVEPHITEKATALGEKSNHYAFKVDRRATKREIREAVETLFGVKVEGVTTLNVKGGTKRNFRGVVSRTRSWKKAYVRLAEGEDLDYSVVET